MDTLMNSFHGPYGHLAAAFIFLSLSIALMGFLGLSLACRRKPKKESEPIKLNPPKTDHEMAVLGLAAQVEKDMYNAPPRIMAVYDYSIGFPRDSVQTSNDSENWDDFSGHVQEKPKKKSKSKKKPKKKPRKKK
jgi:hypothetical protein